MPLNKLDWSMFQCGALLMLSLWEVYADRYGESAVSLFFAGFFLYQAAKNAD